MKNARPRCERGAGANEVLDNRVHTPPAPNPQRNDPAFRRQVEAIHAHGPRALGELLIELGADAETLKRYARLQCDQMYVTRGDHWAPAPIHEVKR